MRNHINKKQGKKHKPVSYRKHVKGHILPATEEEKKEAHARAVKERKATREAYAKMKREKLENIAPPATPTVDPVKKELAQRELARRRLIHSVLRFNPDYLAGWVHKDICARLEQFMRDVELGKSPGLMLQMPPRHGKSTLASIEFPAWVLGQHPEWEFIVCSYADSLAMEFSFAVRERLRDPEFQVLFPKTKLDPDNQNVKGWKTKKVAGKNKPGGYLPAGVRGGVTGKGAHILIVDDPVKNAEEADSETTREANAKWYSTTAYTRLAPGGGVLIIQTRWHLDDLSGRLEKEMNDGTGDVFEVVRYPAIATEDERWRMEGEPLHAERYSINQLEMIKRAVGPRTWGALYQQNPVPEEGAQFQRSMIQYYRAEEIKDRKLSMMAAWDLAIGQRNASDFTVGITGGTDVMGHLYVMDMRRNRMDAKVMVDEICDSFIKWKPITIGLEKDRIIQALGPYLDDEIGERGLYELYYEELKPTRDKVARSRTLQGLMRQGKVFFPHPDEAPWVEVVISELLSFPFGRFDDCVDALAWLAILCVGAPDPEPKAHKIPKRKSWRDRLRPSREKNAMTA